MDIPMYQPPGDNMVQNQVEVVQGSNYDMGVLRRVDDFQFVAHQESVKRPYIVTGNKMFMYLDANGNWQSKKVSDELINELSKKYAHLGITDWRDLFWLSINDKLVVNNKTVVYFNTNQSTLSQKERDKLAKMPDNGDLAVLGFADQRGKLVYNQKLSESRAKYVSNWLTNQGYSVSKVLYFGELNKVATQDNENYLDRRAEVIVTYE